MASKKSVLGGFVAGAALGAIAGILFAPHKGKVTQKIVLEKMNEIKGIVAAKAAAMKEITAEAYENLVDEATLMAKKKNMTPKQIAQLREDLMERWDDLRKKIRG